MQPSLFDQLPDPDPRPVEPPPPDQAARDFAIDPDHHVVLEASAGTGKTRVLVDRYVRLIERGVDPRHVLAMTFTRKAAAEMRDRVLAELNRRAATNAAFAERWVELAERVTDIQVSTIDAFCFGLLREFPLEADVDPAFEIADETEMARFVNEALDLTWRRARGIIGSDENVRLLLARVRLPQLREALAACIDRRHVAQPAVAAFIDRHVRFRTSAEAGAAFVSRVRDALNRSPHRRAILDDGPMGAPEFVWLQADLAGLGEFPATDTNRVQQLEHRLTRYFLTADGEPRAGVANKRFKKDHFPSADAKRRHDAAVKALAPEVHDAVERLASDVNGLLARGLQRVLAIAVDAYERLLEEHALLDFAGMLARSVALLARQEEFARSRLKLQARYHHLLIDEFQDTSRLQWRLVELLIDAWGEGEGATDAPTSIFVVGDRKQSIYRFRHAEVTLLDEAARKIAALRPGFDARRAITNSFRALPELLAFVNTLAGSLEGDPELPERFRYDDSDRFPVPAVQPGARRDGDPVLGLIAESSLERSAAAVAAEVVRLLGTAVVRDRQGPPRPAVPGDIAILFRARAGHQYFEEALEAHGVRSYVYKGLGFFDAPEVQDLQALLRYLAQPDSDLRAAEFLRSRFVRLSDVALARLAPNFAATLDTGSGVAWPHRATPDPLDKALDPVDTALLDLARAHVARWLRLADRITPSQLIDTVIRESAYTFEMRGGRLDQARENVKKVRALVRRVENRGYATLGRLAEYFETLKSGEESNAIVAAHGCVNLMTIHAAKGLEFPIVFVVNIHAGGAGGSAVSVIEQGPGGEPHVAFGSTEGTRLEDRREKEELRRLLYVAVTRARDRLYLAGTVDRNGKLMRGGRSLASLLPATLVDCFTAGASSANDVTWRVEGPELAGFAFRVCRPAEGPAAIERSTDVTAPEPDTAPLTVSPPFVTTATSDPAGLPSVSAGTDGTGADGTDRTSRLIGTIVHRLFRRSLGQPITAAEAAALVPQLVGWEELVDIADPEDLARRAAELFVSIRRRPDVTALLDQGACFYEVPFSCRPSGRPDDRVRGAIDCLVLSENRATILEFKTGRPRPEHAVQAAVYAEATQAALPDCTVDVKIIYPAAK
jgi:ATP-dependent helicase/nuclease subunit A